MKKNRRNFLKNIGLIGGTGLLATLPFKSDSKPFDASLDSPHETEKDEIIQLTILQTTDVHCQVEAHDELFWENNQMVFRKTGGYANLAAYLNKIRKKNPSTFLMDTGDMFQGSELSAKTTGKAMLPILNALAYDLYLPGNWEIIYGKKNMQTLLGGLHAPKVCANMYHDLGDSKKGELIFPPYFIWNAHGVKIGMIGYTDPMVPIRQSPAYSKGIIYTKPEENLAYYVDVLRKQENCAFVLIAAHLGLSQQIALANNEVCKGVDYILGGDTHERVRKPIQCSYSKVVEPGAFGSFVGRLELTVKEGKVIKDEYFLDEIESSKYKPLTQISALIKENLEPFDKEINTIIGYSTIPLYRYFVVENPIDTMILDALKWKINDVDIVLSNGFRFCPPRVTPDKTGMIPITEGFLYDMFPVDSAVRKGEVKGSQLTEWMEKELNNVFAKDANERLGGWVVKFKGMKVSFNAFGQKGQRVKEMLINGMPIEADKTYKICACEREGDPIDMVCRMKNVMNTSRTEHSLHTIMREYLTANSPVTPTPQANADILDAPKTLLTQVTGVDYTFR